MFINCYAAIHTLYEIICLIQYIAYMSGKSSSHSPLLKALSLSLTYVPNIAKSENVTWSSLWSNVKTGNIR